MPYSLKKKEIRRRMDAHSKKSEVFNKDLENIKNNQTEMKTTITEMKDILEGSNSRLNDTKQRSVSWKTRVVEIITSEQKKTKTNEDSLKDLWDNIKHNSMCIIGVPEEEERERGRKNI